MAKIREKEEILAGLDKEYEDCCKILNEKQKNGMDAMSMHIYENYLDTLGFRIRNARQDLELLQRQGRDKTATAAGGKKESTSLEKLKERRLEEYQIGFQKQMEKEIEEYISNNRIRLWFAYSMDRRQEDECRSECGCHATDKKNRSY